MKKGRPSAIFEYVRDNIPRWSFEDIRAACQYHYGAWQKIPENTAMAIEALTLLNDRRYSTGDKKRNHIIYILREALSQLFSSLPGLDAERRPSKRLPPDRLRDAGVS